jgi:hypothetical protein
VRKVIVAALVGLAVVSGLACTDDPDDSGPTKVTDRTELTNGLPGCEKIGNKCVRIRICVQSGGCKDYAPSDVKDCVVGSNWPACRRD